MARIMRGPMGGTISKLTTVSVVRNFMEVLDCMIERTNVSRARFVHIKNVRFMFTVDNYKLYDTKLQKDIDCKDVIKRGKK